MTPFLQMLTSVTYATQHVTGSVIQANRIRDIQTTHIVSYGL